MRHIELFYIAATPNLIYNERRAANLAALLSYCGREAIEHAQEGDVVGLFLAAVIVC